MAGHVSYQISYLLDKMNSADKDFRYMATTDLMAELQNDALKLDDNSERGVVRMLLKLLRDKNAEVQNLAVKCLGPLVSKVRDSQLEAISEALCSDLHTSPDEHLRDVSSMALKTLIGQLPKTHVGAAGSILSRLTAAEAAQLEALDMVGELLAIFGPSLTNYHSRTLWNYLFPLLTNDRPALRKRAILAIGYLVQCCAPELLAALLDKLLEALRNANMQARPYVLCVGAIVRQAGHRLNITQTRRLVPCFTSLAISCESSNGESSEEDELRECCLQGLEAVVRRCPAHLTNSNVLDIVRLAIVALSHDPNYSYADDDEDDVSDESEDYSDDDDVSWKVRRAAARLLEAVITCRPPLDNSQNMQLADALLDRFKEREESVKTDVFAAFLALLKRCPSCVKVDIVWKELMRQLVKTRSVKTRQGALSVLAQLSIALPGSLSSHLSAVTSVLATSLAADIPAPLRLTALSCLHQIFLTHKDLNKHLQLLLPALVAGAKDKFYKVAAESLTVLSEFADGLPDEMLNKQLATASERLTATGEDQEVRERAILCLGSALAAGAHDINGNALGLLLARLNNEMTRLVAVRALTKVALSSHQHDISRALPALLTFLRKTERSLRVATLECLLAYTWPQSAAEIAKAVSGLISENDLSISQLTLRLVANLARHDSQAVGEAVLPSLLSLLKSHVLQGAALDALQSALETLNSCGGLNLNTLLPVFVEMSTDLSKSAQAAVSRCMAALVVASNMHAVVVKDLIQFLSRGERQIFALLTLGEIGRRVSLANEQPMLTNEITECFSNQSEDIKTAAAYALGCMSVQCFDVLLPFILSELDNSPKRQFVLLLALKEAISAADNDALRGAYETQLWNSLLLYSDVSEEGCRTLVSECLGKLTLLSPEHCLYALRTLLQQSPGPLRKSTLVSALKFAITDKPHPVDKDLPQVLSDFLALLSDSDLNVRRNTLITINCAAHNKPLLLAPLINNTLPALYAQTEEDKKLIREVEMGPFKHTIDDGLDIRKTAYECMYTLLERDVLLAQIDIFEFLSHVLNALRDQHDVKMLAYLMLIKLASLAPAAVQQQLSRILDHIKATVTSKVKNSAVKQEQDKQDELKRSAFRAVHGLLRIPDVERNPAMLDFLALVRSTSEYSVVFDNVRSGEASTQSIYTHDSAMDTS